MSDYELGTVATVTYMGNRCRATERVRALCEEWKHNPTLAGDLARRILVVLEGDDRG